MTIFSDDAVPLALLRQRAYNLRWATQPPDVIPLTAADPDFQTAPVIREALADFARSGVYSYGPAEGLPEFRRACADMFARRKGMPIVADQVLAVDSAAAGMLHVARLVIRPGDEAIVFDPVDFLFKASVEAAGGTVKLLPVDPITGALDLDALPRLLTARTRLLGVCNPLNPVGRVLTPAELRVLGEFAVAHDLWIMNDEIWSDIVHAPHVFTSLPTLSSAIAARCFTVYGFSKTFGLAGLRVGAVIAPDLERFEALVETSLARTTMTGVSTLSQVAAMAACDSGWPWAEEFLAHLTRMRDLGVEALRAVPGVSIRPPEGTYVLFPRVAELGVDVETLCASLRTEARVAVVPGAARWFGPGAEGHLRICLATSEGILTEGLRRLTNHLRVVGRR
jgi:aspartate/methionine/tyrosine aminotransferase